MRKKAAETCVQMFSHSVSDLWKKLLAVEIWVPLCILEPLHLRCFESMRCSNTGAKRQREEMQELRATVLATHIRYIRFAYRDNINNRFWSCVSGSNNRLQTICNFCQDSKCHRLCLSFYAIYHPIRAHCVAEVLGGLIKSLNLLCENATASSGRKTRQMCLRLKDTSDLENRLTSAVCN